MTRSWFSAAVWCLTSVCACAGAPQDPPPPATSVSSLLAYAEMDSQTKLSRVHPGDVLEGRLRRAVYSGDRQIFPAGSRVRLSVQSLAERKKTLTDDWPFVIRRFARRRQVLPVIGSASIALPDNSEFPVRASVLEWGRRLEIHARQHGSAVIKRRTDSAPVSVLRLEPAGAPFSGIAATPKTESPLSREAEPVAIPAGTRARVILMQSLSASRNHRGDVFWVRLEEPVRQGSRVVLPEGSLIEGVVARRVPPRRLSRPGALYLNFTKLVLPGGAEISLAASPAGMEGNQGPHMTMDAEGGLHGGRPGVKGLLLEVGVTAGIAKVTDDSIQLIIELVISTATDASTAGTARIFAACISGLYLATRHGHDVAVSRYTEMEISLNRAVLLPDQPAQGTH